MVFRSIVFFALLFLGTLGKAQVPDTDIYLIDMEYDDGQFTFGEPRNVTNREGYDNQPYFMPTKEGILFSSDRSGGKTDIYHYYAQNGQIINLTQSPDRAEYSPRFTPDKKHFSVVMVEPDDSTQRIWQFENPGRNPEIVWEKNKQVGYYCWLDKNRLAAFVLGDSFTLHIYNRANHHSEIVAGNIGRCLLPIPHLPEQVSYVSKRDSTNWSIRRYNPTDSTDYFIADCIPGNEDFAWLNDGSLLMPGEGKLWHFRPGEDSGWREVADFSKVIGPFYRVVVDEEVNKIAVVGYRGEKP